jgi:hypothetical protein
VALENELASKFINLLDEERHGVMNKFLADNGQLSLRYSQIVFAAYSTARLWSPSEKQLDKMKAMNKSNMSNSIFFTISDQFIFYESEPGLIVPGGSIKK